MVVDLSRKWGSYLLFCKMYLIISYSCFFCVIKGVEDEAVGNVVNVADI